jgi:hypothetical protein
MTYGYTAGHEFFAAQQLSFRMSGTLSGDDEIYHDAAAAPAAAASVPTVAEALALADENESSVVGRRSALSESAFSENVNAPRTNTRRRFGAVLSESAPLAAASVSEARATSRRTASPSQLRDIMAGLDDSSSSDGDAESEAEAEADEDDDRLSDLSASRRARRESGYFSFGGPDGGDALSSPLPTALSQAAGGGSSSVLRAALAAGDDGGAYRFAAAAAAAE